MLSNGAVLAYYLATLGFVALVYALAVRLRTKGPGNFLYLPAIVGIAWGVLSAQFVSHRDPDLVLFSEAFYDAAWMSFLAMLLRGSVASPAVSFIRWSGLGVSALALLAALGATAYFQTTGNTAPAWFALGSAQVAASLVGLIILEQVYRNSRPRQRPALRYIAAALAAIFVYDAVLFAPAVFGEMPDSPMWQVRGYFTVAATLVLGYGVSKLPPGGWGLFVSRKLSYFAISTAAAVVVLAVFVAAAFMAGDVPGRWNPAVRIALFSIGLLALVVLALSDSVRAHLAVLLKKHLMEPKFDYREEWLRLIETMTDESLDLSLDKRAIKSLAQIVPAESGQLWFRDAETNQYAAIAAWDESRDERTVPASNPVVEFLGESGWVVDVRDVERNPGKYEGLDADAIRTTLPGVDLLIPLQHEKELIGYAALRRLDTTFALDYEVHELFKTAGKQVASFLIQARASEKLAEARQFEAYNRFTAFVMHDLKNAIAQQSLVVDNAEKHKRNPEFIDDAIDTIKAGVQRMRRVLRYLQQRPLHEQRQRVEMTKLLFTVASECSDRQPLPRVRCPDFPVFIRADRERLQMALGHAVRNAQDATDGDGEIFLELTAADSTVDIVIRDSGRGMDPIFVRDRLFRPFDSTKGADGMGIGAYQLRETVRSIGGDLSVESHPGEGTAITIVLPGVT